MKTNKTYTATVKYANGETRTMTVSVPASKYARSQAIEAIQDKAGWNGGNSREIVSFERVA